MSCPASRGRVLTWDPARDIVCSCSSCVCHGLLLGCQAGRIQGSGPPYPGATRAKDADELRADASATPACRA